MNIIVFHNIFFTTKENLNTSAPPPPPLEGQMTRRRSRNTREYYPYDTFKQEAIVNVVRVRECERSYSLLVTRVEVLNTCYKLQRTHAGARGDVAANRLQTTTTVEHFLHRSTPHVQVMQTSTFEKKKNQTIIRLRVFT